MNRKPIFLLLLALFLIPNVFAKQGHMKLLAVTETETGYEGGIADLYLEIKPGSGRVFLETFPLTKTDTQMSTRFAKAIACDFVERDCDDMDFFYTITADSPIIAGPSAGASIAVLTVAMLEGYSIDEKAAITGTINSGGLVGNVGGLKAKIEAAKAAGLEKVLIPAGEMIIKVDNATVDLKNLSQFLGIQVIEASTLGQAVKEFTGKQIVEEHGSIEISQSYTDTMKSIAKELCDRSSRLRAGINASRLNNLSQRHEEARNLTIKGKEAFERSQFYSSASYCFGANVDYSIIAQAAESPAKEDLNFIVEGLEKEVSEFLEKVDSAQKNTITDLEAYIVVKERLFEAQASISQAGFLLNSSNVDSAIASIAYAKERIKSADSWSRFFGKGTKKFVLNKEVLKKSCQNKISEAEERKQYVELYFPGILSNIDRQLEKSEKELASGNYELCLSSASKAKADVDIILSVFGVESSQYENLLQRKLDIVESSIARQASKGIFPVLGYSYYEYANSLKKHDILSALLYSEYALELGNLDIYFKESNGKGKAIDIDTKYIGIFLIGLLIGFIAAQFVKRKKQDKSKINKKKFL